MRLPQTPSAAPPAAHTRMRRAAGGKSAAARRPPPEGRVPPPAGRRRRAAAPTDHDLPLPRQAPATVTTSSRATDTDTDTDTTGTKPGVLEKTRKTKRCSDATRSFGKNRKARKIESVVSGHLHVDPNENVWNGLSDDQKSYLSKSVALITLCAGDTTLFSCSGIAIDRKGNYLTRFLTSASLVRNLHGPTIKGYIDVKITVLHEGNEVHDGYLSEVDLDHNIAVVNVYTFLDVQCGLQHVLKIPPHGDVLLVALGRDISGKLITTTVKLSGNLGASEDEKDLDSKTFEAWEGGPLFSSDGNFVGMNLFLTERRAFFLPWNTLFEHMKQQISLAHLKFLKVQRFGVRPIGEKSNRHLEDLNQEQLGLDSLGYPKLPSTMSNASMILVNTFEETFGDIFSEGVWGKLSKKASSDMKRSVVALASFNGEKRFFACTGFFIEWNGSTVILTSASLVRCSGDENKIVENLRIKVALPGKRFKVGKLQHCCLQYNIAIVSVMDYNARRPANVLVHGTSSEVAAVGFCFESGALMATTGQLIPWTGTLDCEFLVRSSCKITKAGIGGPLVTMDGDVIGMNFYDIKIGTPFLPWEVICNILESFEGKSKAGEVGNDGDSSSVPFHKLAGADIDRSKIKAGEVGKSSFCKVDRLYHKHTLNRWPVPMPCWRRRDYVDEDKSDDDDDDDGLEYGFIDGEKVMVY